MQKLGRSCVRSEPAGTGVLDILARLMTRGVNKIPSYGAKVQKSTGPLRMDRSIPPMKLLEAKKGPGGYDR